MDVEKIGLAFSSKPPERLVVSMVTPETWAAFAGFVGGEEIVHINSRKVSDMSVEDFKAAMKERPLQLKFLLADDLHEDAL